MTTLYELWKNYQYNQFVLNLVKCLIWIAFQLKQSAFPNSPISGPSRVFGRLLMMSRSYQVYYFPDGMPTLSLQIFTFTRMLGSFCIKKGHTSNLNVISYYATIS